MRDKKLGNKTWKKRNLADEVTLKQGKEIDLLGLLPCRIPVHRLGRFGSFPYPRREEKKDEQKIGDKLTFH